MGLERGGSGRAFPVAAADLGSELDVHAKVIDMKPKMRIF
jgi:hypothetical protein